MSETFEQAVARVLKEHRHDGGDHEGRPLCKARDAWPDTMDEYYEHVASLVQAEQLAARDERISKLRSRFIDLADDFEKHGNDRLRHIDPAERLGGAVEGVCADRIRALLAEEGK